MESPFILLIGGTVKHLELMHGPHVGFIFWFTISGVEMLCQAYAAGLEKFVMSSCNHTGSILTFWLNLFAC